MTNSLEFSLWIFRVSSLGRKISSNNEPFSRNLESIKSFEKKLKSWAYTLNLLLVSGPLEAVTLAKRKRQPW